MEARAKHHDVSMHLWMRVARFYKDVCVSVDLFGTFCGDGKKCRINFNIQFGIWALVKRTLLIEKCPVDFMNEVAAKHKKPIYKKRHQSGD